MQQPKGPVVPPPLPQERRRTPPREPAANPTAAPHRIEEPVDQANTSHPVDRVEAVIVADSAAVASAALPNNRMRRSAEDPDYLLISRRRIQAYVLLLIGTGVLAFIMGRGTAGSRRPHSTAASSSDAKTPADPVLLTGYVHFAGKGKPLAPDAGAVIIALPLAPPQERLAVEGLRPWNTNLALRKEAADQAAGLGGAFAQADEEGSFNLVVSHPGEYRLLIISNSLARPAAVTARPNRGIDELDLKGMAQYFDRPADLIGPQVYHWTRVEVRPGMTPLRHVFQEGDDLGLDQIGLP